MTVNMDTDRGDLCLEVNCLLKDICNFLESSSINLSPADKKKANKLIERSKEQLEYIEKVSIEKSKQECDIAITQLQDVEIYNRGPSERYVDMSKKPELPQRPALIVLEQCEAKCPYQDLPAKEASQKIKYGSLSKRRKMFNLIDVSTKVYASIHENWLLIYSSAKDPKPECALDLKSYEAKEDETDPNMKQLEAREEAMKKNSFNPKMPSSFTVFHSSCPDKKSYSFVAMTHKDMLQWVVNINRRHDKAVLFSKYLQNDRVYEICQDFNEPDQEENIYNEIEMPSQTVLNNQPISRTPEIDDRPALPEKRPIDPDLIPAPPSLSTSTESIVLYEELETTCALQNSSIKSSSDSSETSSDEEGRTYNEVNTKVKIKKETLKEDTANVVVNSPLVTTSDGHTPNTTSIQNLDTKPSEVNESKEAPPSLLRKRSSKPTPIKPKILSPKPWSPFKRGDLSKGQKHPLKSKTSPGNESTETSLVKEIKSTNKPMPPQCSSGPAKIDSAKSSNIWSSKPHQGSSIVKIIRNRWSTTQSPSCSLETFSNNTKIETFQASPTKDSLTYDYFKTTNSDLNQALKPIETLPSDSSKDEIDQKPMVLLKNSLEDEQDMPKQLKKSPVVPNKPKKVSKMLAL